MNTEQYKYSLCTKGGIHAGQILNLVCLEPQCIQKSIICSICYYQEHQHHKIRPLKFVVNNSKKHLKQMVPGDLDVQKIKLSIDATRNKLLSVFDEFDRETRSNLGGIRNIISSIFIKIINQIQLKNNRNDELLLALQQIKNKQMDHDSFIDLMQRLIAGVPTETEDESEDLNGGEIEKSVKGIQQKVQKDINLYQKNIKVQLQSFMQIIQKTADSLSIFDNKVQNNEVHLEVVPANNAFAPEEDWQQ